MLLVCNIVCNSYVLHIYKYEHTLIFMRFVVKKYTNDNVA